MKALNGRGKVGSGIIILVLALVILQANVVQAAGDLQITPVEDFEPSGEVGGPFTPSYKEYELTNTGTGNFYCVIIKTTDWLTLDPTWVELTPGVPVTVTVSLNAMADVLEGGVHNDTVTFHNVATGEEETRGVTLTISAPPGELEITPEGDFEPSGEPGGPFSPSSKDYQLENVGGQGLFWGIDPVAAWLDLSGTSGHLDPDEFTTVTVSLNAQAEALGEGVYTDTLTFRDLSNAVIYTRDVTLSIVHIGGIWVAPEGFDVEVTEGLSLAETLTIGNDGTEDINFTIQTRVVNGSEQSGQTVGGALVKQEDTSFAGNKGRDFTMAGSSDYKPGELIVRFGAKVNGKQRSISEKTQILSSLGISEIKREYELVPGLTVIKLPAGMMVEEALVEFNNTEGILYAQPNYRVYADATLPNDTRFNDLWGMHNTGQTGGTVDADIDAPEAWDIGTGSSEIIVAVIDSGVDYTHIDLAANMWVNQAELDGTPGQDDDGNGYVDDIYGYDFCNYDGDPMDDHYHGTHCAGTIGGVGNNGEGVAGVCWTVKIMALKFLDSGGGGWSDDAIKCVEYSVLMGANLSSNSWGGGSYNQGLKDAIEAAGQAGMLFVASAGNSNDNNDIYPHYPSSYDCESLIAVLATDDNDNKAGFSCYGLNSVDLGAPGVDILSCKPGNAYQYLDGTSMATPHVAGACALVWSMNTMLSNAEVKDLLLQTVDKISSLNGKCVSEGRLNLYNAILETSVPWLQIDPEEGMVSPDGSMPIGVTFNPEDMAVGTYEAEIIVNSDDPARPALILPVTMTVVLDDLQIVPDEDFESSGLKQGPFTPACKSYTLTNIGTEAVSWATHATETWLNINPNDGVLNPTESIVVNVCITPEADLLDPGTYAESVAFVNTENDSVRERLVTLTVNPPDCFTESFSAADNDLDYYKLTFRPDGSVAYYAACLETATGFPIDPSGGTYVSLGDDDFAEVVLSDGVQVWLYGQSYDRFYIGSNGYITFGQGDTEYNDTLGNHFDLPRISGLFVDLTPANSESISWKQLDDRVVVTFEDVPLWGDKTATNSFQVEMFLIDETIRITYLNLTATDGIAGLSEGYGLPVNFPESDLNGYIACCECGDLNGDSMVNLLDSATLSSYWMNINCQSPDWCGRCDVDRSTTVDIADLLVVAGNWLTGECTYSWGEPTLLTELNDPSGYDARQPFLSSDRLTMYFRRFSEEGGYLYEAYRDNPYGPFTSERELSLEKALWPWVSADGLRMYYTKAEVEGTDNRIHMAVRSDVSDPWTIERILTEIHADGYRDQGPYLTSDELTIFWSSPRPGGPGSFNIWTATRTDTGEEFSNVTPVNELNLNDWNSSPRVFPDGLTIYFYTGGELHKAIRPVLSEPFGNITPVLIDSDIIGDVYVTPDEMELYFDDYVQGIWFTHAEREYMGGSCLPK